MRLSFSVILILSLCPGASSASEILKAPKKVNEARLKSFLLETAFIQYPGHQGLHFRKDKTVDSPVAEDGGSMFDETAMFSGRYQIKGDQVIIQGTHKLGCNEINGVCKQERKIKMNWKVQLSDQVILINNQEFLTCQPVANNPLKRKRSCFMEGDSKVMQLRRAGADDEVWNEVRYRLTEVPSLTVIEGPEAKNPREESEFWYRLKVKDQPGGITPKNARKLFFDMVPTVGEVTPISEPAQWKWKTPYDLILLVGKKQTSPPP